MRRANPDQNLIGRFGLGAHGGKIVVRGASPRTEERADRRPSSSPNAADPGVGSVAAGSRVTLRACARWKPTRPCSPTSSARSSAAARASRPFSSTARRWRWRSAPAAATPAPPTRSRRSSPGSGSRTPRCSSARSHAGSSSSTSPRTTSASGACARASAREAPDRRAAGSLRDAVQRLAGVGVQRRRAATRCWATPRCASCSPRTRPRPAGAPRWRSSRASSPSCATSTSATGPPGARRSRAGGCSATVQELWGSDELRAVSPTVARRGAQRASSTSSRRWPRSCPTIYRDLEEAIAAAYPGDDDARAAAADLRLVDRRRPRRQPVRHAGRDRGRARPHARAVPAPARAAPDAAGRAHLALGPRRRARGRARAACWPRGAERSPSSPSAGAQRNPRGALPARVHAHARARARDAPRAPRAATPTRASCSPTCAPPTMPAAPAAATSARRRRPARRHPPGRGLRLPLRAPGRARARRPPPRRARPRSSSTLGVAEDYAAPATRPTSSTCSCALIADRRPLVPGRHRRLLAPRRRRSSRRSACSHAALDGRARGRDAEPTSSPAPRARPTCSRCCCS